MKGKVYALVDPFTEEVRYVGFTRISLTCRFSQHKHEALKKNRLTHCYTWFRYCVEKGALPLCKLLEDNIAIEDWEFKESFWISQFDNLTNIKSGGIGIHLNTNKAGRQRSIQAHEKKVVQLDSNSKKIKIWESVTKAETSFIGKHTGNIARAIKNGSMAHGYLWVYLKDFEKGIIPTRIGKHWKSVYLLDMISSTIVKFETGTALASYLNVSSATITKYAKSNQLLKKRYYVSFNEDIVRSFSEN